MKHFLESYILIRHSKKLKADKICDLIEAEK